MYDKVKYQGITLVEWAKKLRNQFTPGELYLMLKSGHDICSLSSYNITNAS